MRRPGRALALAAFAVAFACPALAEVLPVAGPGDPHIQSILYDPQQVVALHVAAGFATTVAFAPDERIETVTLGDAASWQVVTNRRADHLVIRPTGAGSTTNLTVITDQHVYNFSLYGAMPGAGVLPYVVSFAYALPPPQSAAPLSGRYRLRGERALWPEQMSDDGTATSLRWAADAALPAIYAENADGQRALINGMMRQGVYVIEGVHERLLFVAGDHRASATREPAGDGK
ncbi:MAG TPA: TrbG/VirB9 family P-type conjugative transfer protein [Novosphingobium sp.]|nr:TrbG/VirB9 family P-type conjugative transfer protein [Novosphingobium sp.]